MMLSQTSHHMKRRSAQAELYLNDELVGLVEMRGTDTSWSFGEFKPNDAFEKYAQFFGVWSLLVHEETDGRLHEATSAELREAENAIDRLKARLHFIKTDEWQRAAQINIDGTMIEWKQY